MSSGRGVAIVMYFWLSRRFGLALFAYLWYSILFGRSAYEDHQIFMQESL